MDQIRVSDGIDEAVQELLEQEHTIDVQLQKQVEEVLGCQAIAYTVSIRRLVLQSQYDYINQKRPYKQPISEIKSTNDLDPGTYSNYNL